MTHPANAAGKYSAKVNKVETENKLRENNFNRSYLRQEHHSRRHQ